MRRNSLANSNDFANEIAKMSASLRKFLANGRLRQNSLAIANAMAWCTQVDMGDGVVVSFQTNLQWVETPNGWRIKDKIYTILK